MSSARAVVFAAPRRVDVGPVAVPAPGDGQVVVRTAFSGISAGTEMLAYRGQLDPDVALDETIGALGGTFRYPFSYGYSCTGVVESTRSELAEGTAVFAFHPHQDRFVADVADVIALGDADLRVATLFPLVETALQVALDAGPVLEERVVVLGLGAVGMLSALMLQRAGARVLGADPLAWRRDAARDTGVTAVDPPALADALAGRGGDGSVSLVVEASGSPVALRQALALSAHEGTVLVVSWYGAGDVAVPLGAEFHRRRLTIRSTQVSTIPARQRDRWSIARRRRTVLDLLDALPLARLATHTFPFADAAAAYAAVDAGEPGLIHAALGYE